LFFYKEERRRSKKRLTPEKKNYEGRDGRLGLKTAEKNPEIFPERKQAKRGA
jgi:hypothetical protein